MGLLATLQAVAHTPHDPVMGFGISPNYAIDRTLFVASNSERTWGYPDALRSTDAGETWTKLPKGMDNRSNFSAIRVSPNFALDRTVIAGTIAEGVYVSRDGGDSWKAENAGLPTRKVTALRIAATGPGTFAMFVVLKDGGIFRRLSTETAWKRVLGKSYKITAFALSPDYAFSRTVVVAHANGKLRRSDDGGATWRALTSPIPTTIYDIAIAPGAPAQLFVAGALGGVRYSSDGGVTFVHLAAGLPAEKVNRIAVSPNYASDRTVFCTTIGRAIFRSVDGGQNWQHLPAGVEITGQTAPETEFLEIQLSSAFAADRTVFLSAFDGLFVSSDGGVSWSERQTRKGLLTSLVFSPQFQVDRALMASEYAAEGLFASRDAGTSWTRARTGHWPSLPAPVQSFFDVAVVAGPGGTVQFAAARNEIKIGFSSDYGGTWREVSIPPFAERPTNIVFPTVVAQSPQFALDQTLFVGTRSHGLLRSADAGLSWTRGGGLPTTSQVGSIVVSPAFGSDGTAFAGNLRGEIFATSDAGLTWSRVGADTVTTPVGDSFVSIAVSPNFAADATVVACNASGLFVSTDRGARWARVASAAMGDTFIAQQVELAPDFPTSREAYINVRGKGLYRLTLDLSGAVISTTNIGATLLDQNVQFIEFALAPSFAAEGMIIGVSRDRVYRSVDRGALWQQVASPPR